MSMSGGLDSPFYSGSAATSAAVPGLAHVAIGGHAYMLDLQRYKDATMDIIRQQADQSSEPSGASLNPNDLWRRESTSWHLGAGQEFLDDRDALRERFHESIGIDPWTKGEISLLPDTDSVVSASIDQFTSALRVGDYVYFATGSAVSWTQDFVSFTTVTGIPATLRSWTTDGTNVYMGFGAGFPIYSTSAGATLAAAWGGTLFEADLLGYFKNRLMATIGNSVYNLKTPTSRTDLTPLFIPSGFIWTAFGEAPGYILLGGYSGDDSLIWRTTIQPEGTDLTAPVISGRLPDGEQLTALGFYQNLVFVGTNLGVRLADESGKGLSLLPRIDTDAAVECFDPQGDFMWYGLTDFEPPNGLARRSGVGRLSLRDFTIPFRPAYASDLMVNDETRGRVTAILTYQGKRVFVTRKRAGAAGDGGMYVEQDTKVASGTLTTGTVGYGIPEAKLFTYLLFRHRPLPGGASVTATISVDEDDFASAGTSSSEGTTEPGANGTKLEGLFGYRAVVKFVLARGTDTTNGAALLQWTLRAWPTPRRTEAYVFPILIRGQNVDLTGNEGLFIDPSEELQFLKDVVLLGLPVTCQIGPETFELYPDNLDFSDVQSNADGTEYRGTVILVGRRYE